VSDGRSAIGLAPGAPVHAPGQDARKYSTGNPVVRWLIARWLRTVRVAVGRPDGGLLDVGVGEGLALAHFLPQGREAVGAELRYEKVDAARRRVPALAGVVADAGLLPVRDGAAATVTCIEVLEHLGTPERAVAELARVTQGSGGRCVVSVPWEPWFRLGNLARGKNMHRLGNDVEHVQQFTPRRLHRLLRTRFGSVRITRAFPWLVAIASAPVQPLDTAG